MHKSRLLLLVLICLFTPFYHYGQSYLFDIETIGIEDGLPEREIYTIVADKQGYLWISTQGAISRYDGNHFKTYTYQQLSIDEYSFTNLVVDEDNNIWYTEHVDSYQERYTGVINTITDSIYSLENYTNGFLNSKDITNLSTAYQDPNIWFISDKNGNTYEYKNGNFKKVFKENSQLQGQLEPDFHTFLGKDTIIIRDNKQQLLFKGKNPLGQVASKKLYLKEQDILLAGSSNGILKITRRKNPFQTYYEGSSVRGLHIEKDYLWIGQWSNSLKIHLPTLKKESLFTTSKPENSNFDFTSFYIDHQNQLWIGTDRALLIKYPAQEADPTYYYQEQDFPKNFSIPFENSLTHKLWIGTNKGLAYFDDSSQQILPSDLSIIDKNVTVRQLYQNETGIWILTNKGIFLMDAESETFVKHYTEADGFPYINFVHLHEDTDGIFWLATKGGGLIKWEVSTNTIQQFTKQQGLSDNVLYAVYEDEYGNLWLPSNYGLMQFNKTTLNTKNYLPQHGLLHEEFNTFSHTQSQDGTLYFGGLNGVIGFHPKIFQDSINNYTPPLLLSSVKVLETKTDQFKDITSSYIQQQAIELPSDYQILELELSLLDYEAPKNNQYAYQIEGYQDNWVYTKEQPISIFKLPYGQYQVNLKARGASGNWPNEIVTFPLIVKTPFYLQKWFLLSLFTLAVLGVIFFIKRREFKLQKDKERLEQEVAKRTATIAQQAEKLKALDKSKTRFFSNITHEFRTPLTLIIGPLQQLIKEVNNAHMVNQLTGILKNARQILQLINQLLDISKLESGNMKVEISRGDIMSFTQELVDGFQYVARQKNHRLFFETKQAIWETHFDKDKWHKIITNILSNAIKFTPNNGSIQLSLTKINKQEKEWIHFKIKDSGIGIPDYQIPKIFNRFYQTDDSTTRLQEGTGIGLALVKELVALQKGEIKVASKVSEGTTFDIQLPIPQIDSLKTIEKKFHPIDALSPIIYPVASPVQVVEQEQVLKILLIEDNPEMLQYIKSCLDLKKYSIHTASDGVEGIEKAEILIPDLIVSDIMMPLKDGFEVTKTIRQNIATSHIPIILLTAKAALSSRLKGLERGADAYLTKPFSPEELVLRIQKLVELRQSLQKRYQGDNFINEQKAISHSEEDKFIQTLRKIITTNLDDPDLNGETIANKVGISRMQLHRKLKALTGQKTSKFIQLIRLEIAYQLVKEQELNISEISYCTGFSNPSYFSRAFKEKYGIAPSKIVNKKNKKG